uniref:Uncharacterized protein n=1 Tax=Rhizophora mucronata TaxID=61149 RepID=A0A2P2N794_RHIMU
MTILIRKFGSVSHILLIRQALPK